MPLSLGLEDTHVLITGGAGLIGSAVVRAFAQEGAHVSSVDIAHDDAPSDDEDDEPAETDYSGPGTLHEYHGDVADEASLARAWRRAVAENGPVGCCVALAGLDLSVLPHHDEEEGRGGGVADVSVEQFRRTLDVNVVGTFLTARQWLRGIRDAEGSWEYLENACLVLVGSESGWFGERGHPDYAAAKSAVQGGLLKSLAADAPRVYGKARWVLSFLFSFSFPIFLFVLLLSSFPPVFFFSFLFRSVAAFAWSENHLSNLNLCSCHRVNAVAPGPVDTARFRQECVENPEQLWLDAQATVSARFPDVQSRMCADVDFPQTGLGKPVPVDAVARSILFLASDNFSSHVHGQVLNVDSGKQGKVLWPKEDIVDLRSPSQSQTSEED
ncbi:Bacilysin biosynthesis oxidoreductase BacC [Diplodia seriata]|uniref:Bacilysin biosynthesis oxidoreductase BacC n=1 Tax=Diplodia seriata TaxID=420778 RepID=A0A1S8BCK9_9PEZI|nr:Bacilysin biosynthesis oxidoreductase BacC [Diplodia seriata]